MKRVQFLCTTHIVSIVNSTTFVSLPPKTVVSVPLNKAVLDYGRAEIANCIGKLAEALQKMLARLQEKRYVERDDKGGWRVFITPSV